MPTPAEEMVQSPDHDACLQRHKHAACKKSSPSRSRHYKEVVGLKPKDITRNIKKKGGEGLDGLPWDKSNYVKPTLPILTGSFMSGGGST